MDIEVIDRSNGRQVIDYIRNFAQKYSVQNKDIYYDSDGLS